MEQPLTGSQTGLARAQTQRMGSRFACVQRVLQQAQRAGEKKSTPFRENPLFRPGGSPIGQMQQTSFDTLGMPVSRGMRKDVLRASKTPSTTVPAWYFTSYSSAELSLLGPLSWAGDLP